MDDESARAAVAKVRAMLEAKHPPRDPKNKPPLPESTEPTCAGCGVPDPSAILRDGRLWHAACWDRRRGMRGAR